MTDTIAPHARTGQRPGFPRSHLANLYRHCSKWSAAALACCFSLLPTAAMSGAAMSGAPMSNAPMSSTPMSSTPMQAQQAPGTPAAQPASPADTNTPAAMRVVYWVGDMPEPRVRYERELIEQALELTRAEFGDYRLELDRQLRSQERLARDLTSGEGIHILNGPGWSFEPSDEAVIDTHIVSLPLLKGLLGYRRCIIRRQDQARFAAIQSTNDLKQFSMGLGQGWLDSAILRHNGYVVVEAPELEKLYYMLKRGRFDCLPLGVGEAQGSLAEHDRNGELTIADNLLLFYPLPVFMQISERDPLLTRRMEKGLNILAEDGMLDQLFNKHFRDEIRLMQSPSMRVLQLENPFLPAELRHVGTDLIE